MTESGSSGCAWGPKELDCSIIDVIRLGESLFEILLRGEDLLVVSKGVHILDEELFVKVVESVQLSHQRLILLLQVADCVTYRRPQLFHVLRQSQHLVLGECLQFLKLTLQLGDLPT